MESLDRLWPTVGVVAAEQFETRTRQGSAERHHRSWPPTVAQSTGDVGKQPVEFELHPFDLLPKRLASGTVRLHHLPPAWDLEVGCAAFQRQLEVTVNCDFGQTGVLHEVRVQVHTVVTIKLQLKDALQLRLRRLNHGYVASPEALPVASDQVRIATVETRFACERLRPLQLRRGCSRVHQDHQDPTAGHVVYLNRRYGRRRPVPRERLVKLVASVRKRAAYLINRQDWSSDRQILGESRSCQRPQTASGYETTKKRTTCAMHLSTPFHPSACARSGGQTTHWRYWTTPKSGTTSAARVAPGKQDRYGMSFGQRLRDLRRDRDLSQAQLADKAGCSVNTIRKLESDERRPSRELAIRLATVVELPQPERAEFVRLARRTGSVSNIPAPMTRLIGREDDVAVLRERLLRPEVRLLTLIGPPGVGKTRLAQQVATELRDGFRDGAAFVALSVVRDAPLVVDSIARSLGVRVMASRSIEQTLTEYLRQRQLLLVLDNFEQILSAREHVAALLLAARGLTVVVTSREALDIYGEHIYDVPTLGLPRRAPDGKTRGVQPSPSELLFLERARAARASFAGKAGDEATVAEICLRLEGLPLAIELAASRARTLSPKALLTQLNERLDTLSTGPADLPTRQRSIRGALDWSYQLLDAPERQLFGRMALFTGGANMEAIVAVCGDPSQASPAVSKVLESLADKSLLTVSELGDSARFGMLEVIRDYALEWLIESEGDSKLESLHRAHAAHFAARADGVQRALRGPDQVQWFEHIEADHHNFQAALDWSLQNREADLAGRLAAGLWPFWRARGYFREARRWLEATLDLGALLPVASRAAVLNGAGVMAILHSDYRLAATLLDESRELYQALGDHGGVAFAVSNLGWAAYDRADPEHAEACFEESLRIRRALGDTWGEANSINNLGMIAVSRDDARGAATLFEESAMLFRRVGDLISLAQALSNQGWALQLLGEYARASDLFSESLSLAQRFKDLRGEAHNLSNLAQMALYRGDFARAQDLYTDSLSAFYELDDKRGIAESIEGIAGVAGVLGQPSEAARLFGVAASLRDAVGAPLLAGDRSRYESAVAVAREQLDEAMWTQAWEQGGSVALDEEVARLTR
jgi:predicted ATPase/DNA-binding XRE family transcriptional regulator